MRFSGALALVLALVALPLASGAQQVFSLDVILPLTGSAAFAGVTQQAAAKAYETEINKTGGVHGQPLHFDFHDDQSDPRVAVQLANELLAKHPVAVLGPSVTATCAAIAPLFANGPVNYCLSPSISPAKGGWVFASGVTLHDVEMVTYNRSKAMGFKRHALIAATDASGQLSLQYIREWQQQPGNNALVVDVESFAPNDISVAAQVAKIKAANPDIIYIYAIGTAFGTVVRELSNAGLGNVVTYTTPANASVSQLTTYKSFLPKTLITTGMPYQGKLSNPAMKTAATEYLDDIKDAGLKVDPMQSYSWDPIKITVSALRALPAGATAAQLHAYLENLHDFAGLWGVYDFRNGEQHGIDGRDSVYIYYDQAQSAWKTYEGLSSSSNRS